MTLIDPHHSAHHIRRRLFGLLMQAFGIVVAVTVVLLVGLLAMLIGMITSGTTGFRPPAADTLEAYYLGRGSWAGVGTLPAQQAALEGNEFGAEWRNLSLLDAGEVVLIDHGRPDGGGVGRPYPAEARGIRLPLTVEGARVGTLVLHGANWYGLLALFSSLIVPVLVISFFTGMLTLLIGYLLARRVVTPLADVAAAAHQVAGGDLSARVLVRGPGDLRSLSDSFNRMADALETSDRQRRALLADIAHELRTPLTVIRGKLEGMVDGVYPPDEAHVAPVLEETYVLERLVEDLRTLTLAEARQLHFDLRPTDVGDVAERAAALFEAEAGERGISLAVERQPDLPEVPADPQRVGQVIGNLLSNALRYVPEGGHITLHAQHANGGVELAVSDDGPGVEPADLPRLFERFWRGEKSRTRAAGGAGLGLAIARQLVEAQGGAIRAENRAEGGLRVAFVLGSQPKRAAQS